MLEYFHNNEDLLIKKERTFDMMGKKKHDADVASKSLFHIIENTEYVHRGHWRCGRHWATD